MPAIYHRFDGLNYDGIIPLIKFVSRRGSLAAYSWVNWKRKWRLWLYEGEIAEFLTNWTEEMQEYAKYIARLILPTFWGVSLRENVCLYPEILPRNRPKFWRESTRRLSWISSDCFESFSPLSNVVIEGVITTRSNRMKFMLRECKFVAVRLL